MTIKKMVIDVLIPHEPDILVYAEDISKLDRALSVVIHVLEHDERTKTVEMTIESDAISFEDVKNAIEDLGGSIHSIDQVSAGSKIIEKEKEP